MPRYYFHLHVEGDRVPDDEGLELEDRVVARHEAMESLRDLIADSLKGDLRPIKISVEIVQEGVGVIDRLTGQVAIERQA